MLSFVLFLAAMISISFGADSFIEADAKTKDAKTKAVRIPIYRYYQADIIDHLYTKDASEIGTTTPGEVGNQGYTSEGTGFYLEATSTRNNVALYRYYRADVSDHCYTTDPGECRSGYVDESVLGYCFEKQPKRGKTIVPLYSYHRLDLYDHNADHFYTTNCTEIGCNLAEHQKGADDYWYMGIECYVYSSDSRTIDDALFFGLSPQLFLTEENGINWTVIAGIITFIFAIFGMVYYYNKKKKDEYKSLTFDDEV